MLNYLANVSHDVFQVYVVYASSRILAVALHRDIEHLALCSSPLRPLIHQHPVLGCRTIVLALVQWIADMPLGQPWNSISSRIVALLELVTEYISPFRLIEESLCYICRGTYDVLSLEDCTTEQPGVVVGALVLLCCGAGALSGDISVSKLTRNIPVMCIDLPSI